MDIRFKTNPHATIREERKNKEKSGNMLFDAEQDHLNVKKKFILKKHFILIIILYLWFI